MFPIGREAPEGKTNRADKKTVNQQYMDNVVKILHYITPLAQLYTIEVQVSEVTSVGLCGCNLKEKLECLKGIHDGKN